MHPVPFYFFPDHTPCKTYIRFLLVGHAGPQQTLHQRVAELGVLWCGIWCGDQKYKTDNRMYTCFRRYLLQILSQIYTACPPPPQPIRNYKNQKESQPTKCSARPVPYLPTHLDQKVSCLVWHGKHERLHLREQVEHSVVTQPTHSILMKPHTCVNFI